MREVLWTLALGLLPLTPAMGEVSFADDVIPIFRAHCVACHLTGDEQGGLELHAKAAYGDLVGVRSQPEPAESGGTRSARPELPVPQAGERASAGGRAGGPMPMGAWPLEAVKIQRLHQWIAEGAEGG